MGEAHEAHRVFLEDYAIARVPITNAQYQLFVEAAQYKAPEYWNGKRPPRGRELHPVVAVSWRDALAYCCWLSETTRKLIALPSEAEWERASRGSNDTRTYPWGEAFDAARCNVERAFDGTTPVGIFANGASPYGCLDMAAMSGNGREVFGAKIGRSDFAYPYEPSRFGSRGYERWPGRV